MSNSFSFPKETIETSIKEKLGALFKRLEKLPVSKEHHFIALQEYGNLLDILRRTVDEKKIDLISMGTKGASGIKEVVIESNTGDAITKIPCNLLVIPEKAVFTSPEKIAFPTDYNIFYSNPILEAISEIMQITQARLRVINISILDGMLSPIQERNKSYIQDYLEELFATSHSFQSLKYSTVKTAIEQFVRNEDIDMLIMVGKNLHFLQYLLFDSTIEKLSFHTTVPILVLHE